MTTEQLEQHLLFQLDYLAVVHRLGMGFCKDAVLELIDRRKAAAW